MPGIGPKSAQRIAFHIVQTQGFDVSRLARILLELRDKVRFCGVCGNVAEADTCAICADPDRDRSLICVVEEPNDVIPIERTHEYRGRYHVLHGAVSPVDGIGPDKLRIQELVDRVQKYRPDEVIVFTNLDLPGEATATYLHRILTPLGIRVTRPASGLPVGGDLEYADDMTLGRALKGRREL